MKTRYFACQEMEHWEVDVAIHNVVKSDLGNSAHMMLATPD